MTSRRKRPSRTAIDQVMAGFAWLNGQSDVAMTALRRLMANPGY